MVGFQPLNHNKPKFGLAVSVAGVSFFATFYGKMIDPLVVKDSFLRGSPIFWTKVAKRHPCSLEPVNLRKPEIPACRTGKVPEWSLEPAHVTLQDELAAFKYINGI